MTVKNAFGKKQKNTGKKKKPPFSSGTNLVKCATSKGPKSWPFLFSKIRHTDLVKENLVKKNEKPLFLVR